MEFNDLFEPYAGETLLRMNQPFYNNQQSFLKRIDLLFRIIFPLYTFFSILKVRYIEKNKIFACDLQIIALTTLSVVIGLKHLTAFSFSATKSYSYIIITTFIHTLFLTSYHFRKDFDLLNFESRMGVAKICHMILFFLFFSNLFFLLFTAIIMIIGLIILPIIIVLTHMDILRINFRQNFTLPSLQRPHLSPKHLQLLRAEFYNENTLSDIEKVRSLCSANSNTLNQHATQSHGPWVRFKMYKKLKLVKEKDQTHGKFSMCAICCMKFEKNSLILKIPICGHLFHYICIIHWLKGNPTCPCCRFNLYSHFQVNYPEVR